MDSRVEIVSRINELVNDSLLSPSAFAMQAGLDPGNFRKKIKGEQNITTKDIEKICRARDVCPDWLMSGEGEKYLIKRSATLVDQLKDEIIRLGRKMATNKEVIMQLEVENEDILKKLSTLYSQLDRFNQ